MVVLLQVCEIKGGRKITKGTHILRNCGGILWLPGRENETMTKTKVSAMIWICFMKHYCDVGTSLRQIWERKGGTTKHVLLSMEVCFCSLETSKRAWFARPAAQDQSAGSDIRAMRHTSIFTIIFMGARSRELSWKLQHRPVRIKTCIRLRHKLYGINSATSPLNCGPHQFCACYRYFEVSGGEKWIRLALALFVFETAESNTIWINCKCWERN